MRISVIGAGSWGTTLAALAARSNPVVLWARRPELAETINAQATNPDYMPGLRLPYGLRATADPADAVDGTDVIVMAVPSHGFRDVLERIRDVVDDDAPILSLTKGIEMGTGMRMTEVIAQSLPAHDPSISGVLTGPNLAQEIAAGAPAAAVIGMADAATAARLQSVLMDPTFRIYTNPDVVGCELAGALKNVMAIAAGMAKGLGFGQNTLAALITRALAEITRLGTALGGRPETFAGLAGMGDLIATCESDSSRNNRVGMALARGRRLDDVVSEMQMVAEGVKTVRPVLELANRHGVDMPIASQVARVLYQGAHPREAVLALMTREARRE